MSGVESSSNLPETLGSETPEQTGVDNPTPSSGEDNPPPSSADDDNPPPSTGDDNPSPSSGDAPNNSPSEPGGTDKNMNQAGEASPNYVAVIDTGSRCIRVAVLSPVTKKEEFLYQTHIDVRSPQEGWFEQDPLAILTHIKNCIRIVACQMRKKGASVKDIKALGITNHRESTLIWDKFTGEPLNNAILWSDIRTDYLVDQALSKIPNNNKEYFLYVTGLPISSFFSALKIKWLMENVPAVRRALEDNRCYFGTVDSWIIWNLTGGPSGGIHVTDVTNASRTLLMNIDTLNWDPTLLSFFGIPKDILPEIRSCCEIYGKVAAGPFEEIPISALIGNQHAALIGQNCTSEGLAKNTYRGGCFVLYNTGPNRVFSSHGLVTTIAYKLGPKEPPVYALEGSVAVAGNAIKWLRDNLNVLNDITETESLADEVMTTGDVYFVPAFNGLYAPYWRKDARGILCGITQFTTKSHLIRAALEAVCFQTRDVLEAMHKDCGVPVKKLRADGKMVTNSLLMQLQADIAGIPVVRAPRCVDVTTLGCAIVAGMADGINVWKPNFSSNCEERGKVFEPKTNNDERNHRYTKWKMAVQRSLGWVFQKRSIKMTDERYQLISSLPGTLFLFSSFAILVLAAFPNGVPDSLSE